MLHLVCATSNEHKLREFRQASGTGIRLTGCEPRDCPETGDSFAANARQKAECYSLGATVEWLFADDSGLVVDALNGEPGIRSARFAGSRASDLENNRLLLRRLEGVRRSDRTARFVCSIALLHEGRFVKAFGGEVEGLILRRHSGDQGFGYDPLFYCPPLGKSFGRVSGSLKWEHSHRGKAYRAMLAWIRARS